MWPKDKPKGGRTFHEAAHASFHAAFAERCRESPESVLGRRRAGTDPGTSMPIRSFDTIPDYPSF
jgi:hypothetical protein